MLCEGSSDPSYKHLFRLWNAAIGIMGVEFMMQVLLGANSDSETCRNDHGC